MKPSGTNRPFGLPTWHGGEDRCIQLPGGLVAIAGGETPGSIPNPAVKPPSADDTVPDRGTGK